MNSIVDFKSVDGAVWCKCKFYFFTVNINLIINYTPGSRLINFLDFFYKKIQESQDNQLQLIWVLQILSGIIERKKNIAYL